MTATPPARKQPAGVRPARGPPIPLTAHREPAVHREPAAAWAAAGFRIQCGASCDIDQCRSRDDYSNNPNRVTATPSFPISRPTRTGLRSIRPARFP